MILYNYNDFLFEADENKTYSLVLSPRLRNLLETIDSPIAKKILKSEIGGEQFNISHLDFLEDKDKNDILTFLPVNRFLRNPEWANFMGALYHHEVWTTNQRQEMKVGKIVNTLFPDTFKQKEIEDFVNEFKARINKKFGVFKLVEGEDIRYYYLDDHYENKTKGDINQSCMREEKSQPYLDIYCNNTHHNSELSPHLGWCNLLVLMSDKDPNKIKGRALVWFNMRKPTGKIYMDRIYVIHDADENLYINYAKEHGWLYKTKQVMNDSSYYEDGKKVYSSVAIQLKPASYKYYPSLDTMQYYTPTTGRLGSVPGNRVEGHPRYQLNQLGGGSRKVDY